VRVEGAPQGAAHLDRAQAEVASEHGDDAIAAAETCDQRLELDGGERPHVVGEVGGGLGQPADRLTVRCP
jgi:hypothetical protein